MSDLIKKFALLLYLTIPSILLLNISMLNADILDIGNGYFMEVPRNLPGTCRVFEKVTHRDGSSFDLVCTPWYPGNKIVSVLQLGDLVFVEFGVLGKIKIFSTKHALHDVLYWAEDIDINKAECRLGKDGYRYLHSKQSKLFVEESGNLIKPVSATVVPFDITTYLEVDGLKIPVTKTIWIKPWDWEFTPPL